MRRHSAFEWKQDPEPAELRFAELRDGHKIMGAADGSTNPKTKDLLHRIERVARVRRKQGTPRCFPQEAREPAEAAISQCLVPTSEAYLFTEGVPCVCVL